MTYYIIETQTRPDGQINITTTARSTFASGVSLYHERYSKMVMTDLYPTVSIMLVDQNLKQYEKATITTQYKPAEEEQESLA